MQNFRKGMIFVKSELFDDSWITPLL